MDFSFHLLADRPRHAAVCAAWEHQEWGRAGGKSLEACAVNFSAARRDGLPLTLIACTADDDLAGMISLWDCDCPPRADLHPWAASLYVAPPHRRSGLGAELFRRIQQTAWDLGFSYIHLITQSPRSQAVYECSGWKMIDRVHGPGALDGAAVMRIERL